MQSFEFLSSSFKEAETILLNVPTRNTIHSEKFVPAWNCKHKLYNIRTNKDFLLRAPTDIIFRLSVGMEGTQYRMKLNAPRREEKKWGNIPISTWDIKARKKNLLHQSALQYCTHSRTHHPDSIIALNTLWVLNKYYRTLFANWTQGKAIRALNLWHHGTCLYECKAREAGWKQVSAKGMKGGAGQTSMRMVREEGPWRPLPLIDSSAFCVQNQLKNTRA